MAEPVGSVRVEVSAGTAKFEAGMKKARAVARANGLKIEKSFTRMQRRSQAAARSLTTFRSGLIAIGGATAFLGLMRKAISSSVKLEKGLREVGTLMGGLSKKEMKAMGDELKNISIQTGQALDKLVKAKYDIVSAGFTNAADSAKVLAASADLAVGGVTEISTAADLLTTSLNAYNLSAEDAVDINDKLFTIVRLGKTTMTELAGSMGRVLAIAGQAGVSLDEVGAVLATLTAQGQSTEEATTAVRSAIVQMIKPSATMRGVIEDLGFATGKTMLAQLGFAESLKRLLAKAEESNIPITELFSNIRAMQAVLPLAGTAAGKFADNLLEMKTSSGAAAKAVEEMAKSTDFQLKRMKQAFVVIGQAIADKFVGPIADAAEAIANLFAVEIKLTQAQKDQNKIRGIFTDLLTKNSETIKRLTKRNKDLSTQIAIQTSRIERHGDAVGTGTEKLKRLTDEFDNNKEAIIRAETALENTRDVMGRVKEGTVEVTEETGKLSISALALAESLKLQEEEATKLVRAYAAMLADGGLPDISKAMRETDAEINKLTGDLNTADTFTIQITRSMDSFADAMSRALVSGDDLGDILERLINEMAAAIIKARILGPLMAGVAGGGGAAAGGAAVGKGGAAAFLANPLVGLAIVGGALILGARKKAKAKRKRKKATKKRREAAAEERDMTLFQFNANLEKHGLSFKEFEKTFPKPFRKGGVTTGPELFPMSSGIGIRGEAGPEVVLPLARTSTGDLGVQAVGGGITLIQEITINGPIDEDWFRDVAAPQLVDDARRKLNELQIR